MKYSDNSFTIDSIFDFIRIIFSQIFLAPFRFVITVTKNIAYVDVEIIRRVIQIGLGVNCLLFLGKIISMLIEYRVTLFNGTIPLISYLISFIALGILNYAVLHCDQFILQDRKINKEDLNPFKDIEQEIDSSEDDTLDTVMDDISNELFTDDTTNEEASNEELCLIEQFNKSLESIDSVDPDCFKVDSITEEDLKAQEQEHKMNEAIGDDFSSLKAMLNNNKIGLEHDLDEDKLKDLTDNLNRCVEEDIFNLKDLERTFQVCSDVTEIPKMVGTSNDFPNKAMFESLNSYDEVTTL